MKARPSSIAIVSMLSLSFTHAAEYIWSGLPSAPGTPPTSTGAGLLPIRGAVSSGPNNIAIFNTTGIPAVNVPTTILV